MTDPILDPAKSQLIKKEVVDLKTGEIVFVWVPPENSVIVNIEALRQTFDLGYSCIYVSFNREAGELLRIYHYAGLDTTRIIFIDSVARLHTEALSTSANITYVSGPSATKEILDRIREAAANLSADKKMIYLDSLSGLLAHVAPEAVTAFLRDLAALMKELNAVGIGVSVSLGELDFRLLEELRKIPAKVVDLTKKIK